MRRWRRNQHFKQICLPILMFPEKLIMIQNGPLNILIFKLVCNICLICEDTCLCVSSSTIIIDTYIKYEIKGDTVRTMN